MKNQVKIFLLLAVLLGSVEMASAQVTHYLGGWAQLGEYSFLPKYDLLDEPYQNLTPKTSLGAGGGLGFMYELRAKECFLMDVGVGINSAYSRFEIADSDPYLHNVLDAQKQPFDYVYEVRDRKDAYTTTSLQMPLLLGAQFHRFYFLLGAKFDMAFLVNTKTTAMVSTVGKYPKTGTVRDVPSLGFCENMELEQTGKVSFKPNVTASAEIGWYLGPMYKARGYDVPSRKVQYRLGLFADYGILDSHRTSDEQPVLLKTPSTYNAKEPMAGLVATDLMSSSEMFTQNARFNSLMVGVKFSILFRLPQKQNCLMCKQSRFHSTHGLIE